MSMEIYRARNSATLWAVSTYGDFLDKATCIRVTKFSANWRMEKATKEEHKPSPYTRPEY